MAKTYHNLDVDWGTAVLYEYSKDAKEGFEEHTNSVGTVSWRKQFKAGIYGLLQSISVVDTPLGKKLAIRLMDGDDVFIARFALYDQRGNVDTNFAEILITMLPNLVKEQAYRIFPWTMDSKTSKRKDGTPRKMYGVSIKQADLDKKVVLEGDQYKVEPTYTWKKRDEKFDASKHLPELVFEEELGSWKPTAVSLDTRRKFLVSILDAELNRIGYNPDNNSSSNTPANDAPQKSVKEEPKAEAPAVNTGGTTTEIDDYDDLPF
jgi:hypothetical protein